MNNSVVEIQKFPIGGDGFTISRETKTDANVVYVELERNGFKGAGECVPLKRYGHTPESVKDEIENWLGKKHEWSRENLIATLPAGPARFALDTAMWQLEAAEKGLSFQDYFFLITPIEHNSQAEPRISWNDALNLPTAFTLSGAAPERMASFAAMRKDFRWLKIKLMADNLNAERLHHIHAAAPKTELIVDANEALTIQGLQELLPVFQKCNVILVEQPLPAGKDDALKDFTFPLPIAADESCHDIDSLDQLVGKYSVVNIKLDKSGGLTHALEMKRRAQAMGFKIMVGGMASTSLSILPAFFVALGASYIDLDGALLLHKDREGAKLAYHDAKISLR